MKTLKIIQVIAILFIVLLFSITSEAQKIKVVTTITDLKSITEEIGGEKVVVSSIATGYQNPHFVDPKPSYIIKLSKADLFVTVGLDLEISWSVPLLQSSRNPKIQRGGIGYLDASTGIALLQVPYNLTRAEGDIHIYGNPHYWLDPIRGKQIAQNIFEGLVRVSPENEDYFKKNLKTFDDKIDSKMIGWNEIMSKLRDTKIIAYHNQWVYFETRFGLKIEGFLEPKPGIPPTPKQLLTIIKIVKANNIKVIVRAPYFTSKSSDIVARQTGAKVVVLATSVDSFEPVKTYFDLIDYNINKLARALQ